MQMSQLAAHAKKESYRRVNGNRKTQPGKFPSLLNQQPRAHGRTVKTRKGAVAAYQGHGSARNSELPSHAYAPVLLLLKTTAVYQLFSYIACCESVNGLEHMQLPHVRDMQQRRTRGRSTPTGLIISTITSHLSSRVSTALLTDNGVRVACSGGGILRLGVRALCSTSSHRSCNFFLPE